MLDRETRGVLKDVDTVDALLQLLSGEDFSGMGQRDINSISRAHRRLIEQADCKIAYLGNHTIEPLDVRLCLVRHLLHGVTRPGEVLDHVVRVLVGR